MNTPNLFMEITRQDLEDTLIFKQMKKRLKSEFPWILDVEGDDENPYRYTSTIFVKITFDLDRFAEDTGLTIVPYIKRLEYQSKANKFLNIYSKLCLVTVENCDNPILKKIEEEVLKLLNVGLKSKVYPKEFLEIIGKRVFHIGEWVPKFTNI